MKYLRLAFWAVIGLQGCLAQDPSPNLSPVKIQVDPQTVINPISPDFIGFGYESSAVAQKNYFSGSDVTLIQLYRNLSDHGLIRIGGCASDNTQYIPDGQPVARNYHEVSILNHQCLTDLGDFTQATGWKVMWGLNLGNGTKEQAVAEAVAVDAALGNQLQSLQVGNEVDNLAMNKGSFAVFHPLYLDFKKGIREALPQSAFSGPDTAGRNWGFLEGFAESESKDMKVLTCHYYCTDAHNPSATMEKMLTTDRGFQEDLKRLQKISRDKGIPYRINEVNSFSSGGKPGISDTFASALWALDYMYQLATYGAQGINLQTDLNHLKFISHYSPIVHDEAGLCHARPEYYGMLAFSLTGKGDLIKLTLDKGTLNLSAYATKDDSGSVWLTVINKDMAGDASVEAAFPQDYGTVEAFRLKAPTLTSTDHVTLAETSVADDGKWAPGAPEAVVLKDHKITILVPHASALLVRLTL